MTTPTTVTPLPDPPALRCLTCGETEQLEISHEVVGMVHLVCKRCRTQSFIQHPSNEERSER